MEHRHNKAPLRVLVVDDCLETDTVLQHLLRDHFPRATIEAASTQDSAMAQIQRTAAQHKDYSLAVLDFKLPRADGYAPEANQQLFHFLRQRMPQTVVIHTTAYPSDPEMTRRILQESKINPLRPKSIFLSKTDPMWAEDLVKIVDEIIIPGTGVQQAPSRFQSCFISYSHKDEEFVRHLYSALKSKRLQAWFAAEHMLPGRKLHEEIQNNIPLYDKLLLVLSRSSLNSNWVETEIRTAIAEERKTGRRKLLPIRIVGLDQITEWKCFDADSGKDIAAELREYLIPDFSTWRDTPAFDRNLRKLLEALRA